MINQEQYKIIENCVMKDYKNTAGIIVMKKGQLMLEQYFNDCDAESMVHVYSVTKSIVSILIGNSTTGTTVSDLISSLSISNVLCILKV